MAFYDNLSQQYSAFTDPFGREEEDAVGNARPVTQTIKTDPVTGEQTMTIKGSPYDLSAANPLTPTVAQPVQPTGAGAFLGAYEDMAPPMAQPQMGMAPQMAPPMAPQPEMGMAPQMAQPAQPAPGYDPESIAQVLQQAGLNYAPPQPIAAVAQAPTSDVNPPAVTTAPTAPTAPVAPVAPTVDPGAALTRQAESGGDYNVGYNRAGTTDAFGAYQILSSTYREIQKADPYFAGRDQRTLTPEEQDRANQVIRNMNTKALQSQGVEPSESNIQLAHFLGAKGAADYLTTGYISPAAEAANGGPVKAREIAEKFLALGRGPAVAGVGREMGMGEPGYGGGDVTPGARQFQSVQNDKQGLITMLADKTLDAATRRVAETQLGDLYRNDKAMAAAEKAANAALTGKNGGLALDRLIKKEGDEGSYIKAYIYARLGLTELAKEEQQKLGAGDKWTSTTIDGKPAYIKFNAQGLPVAGVNESGDLSKDELLQAAAIKNLDIVGGTYVNDRTGEVGRVLTDKKTGETYVQTDAGRKPMTGFRPQSSTGTLGDMRTRMLQELNLKLQGKTAEEQMTILRPYNQALVGAGQAPISPTEIQLSAPQIGGGTTGAATTAPTVPTTPGAAAPLVPVAPGAAPPVTTTPPVAAPPVTTAPPAVPRPTVGQIETGTATTKAEQAAFVAKEGTKEQIGTSANDGMAVANVRRQQLDIIKNNPSIINILNGQGTQYDRARRLIINATTGSYGNEDKKILADELNQLVNKLNPAEYGALQEFVNQNTIINAKTLRANSGPGAVSDAESRANKEANIGNVDRIETYAALAGLNRSQFMGDLNASKQAFLTSRPDIKTTSQWNSEWQKRESELVRQYQAIARGRFEIMGKPPKAGAAPQEMSAYRDRVFRAFEVYPAPQFSPATGKWDYVTPNAKRAAMDAV